MQSYIPTYYRLKEPLIALALSNTREGGGGGGGGGVNFCVPDTPPRVKEERELVID